MRTPAVLLACLALLLVACDGDDGQADPAEQLAAQADRVAALLEQGEECRALEAAETLGRLADGGNVPTEAASAASAWSQQARQQLACLDGGTQLLIGPLGTRQRSTLVAVSASQVRRKHENVKWVTKT